MNIRILKNFIHGREKFTEGETRITGPDRQLSDADGEYFCRAGWAEDLDGVVATGNPGPTDVVLHVNDVIQNSSVDLLPGGG